MERHIFYHAIDLSDRFFEQGFVPR